MRADADDAWRGTVLAYLALLEEEVDTPLWPTRSTVTIDEPTFPRARNLEFCQEPVEPVECCSPLALVHELGTCL